MRHKKVRKPGESQSAWLARMYDVKRQFEEAYWADDERADDPMAQTSNFQKIETAATSHDDSLMAGPASRNFPAKISDEFEVSSRYNNSKESSMVKFRSASPMFTSNTSSYKTDSWPFYQSPFPLPFPINKFLLFPKLPLEVRLKIWEYCAPPPFLFHRKVYVAESLSRYNRHPPAVLHACAESRGFFKWKPRKDMVRRQQDENARKNKKEPELRHPLYCLLNLSSAKNSPPVWVSIEYDVLVMNVAEKVKNRNLALFQNVVISKLHFVIFRRSLARRLFKIKTLRNLFIEVEADKKMSSYYDPAKIEASASILAFPLSAAVSREGPGWRVPVIKCMHVASGHDIESAFSLPQGRIPYLYRAAVANGLRVGLI